MPVNADAQTAAAKFPGTTQTQSPAPGLTSGSVINVMFVGNSLTYTHDMPMMFAYLSRRNGVNVHVSKYLAGGQRLSYFLVNNAGVATALRETHWNYIILQDYSDLPLVNQNAFRQDIAKWDPLIKANGAKMVLFENWPYKNAPADTIVQLDTIYADVAKVHHAILAPLGDAVDYVRKTSSINLYADLKHPTALSTYMGASVFIHILFNINPVGNAPGGVRTLPPSFGLATTSAADFAYVQKAAAKFP
jgi:hypothetical protein